jgi:cobalt-zinc-cadmium efflux system outer membrane protein
MMFTTCLLMATALAAVVPLDRAAVLDLARERAPVILAARARQGVAEGDLATARAWRYNPEVELEAGPGTSAARLDQRLDLAGRGARIDAATAGRDVAGFALRETELTVVAGAARAYLVALHASHAGALAAEAAAVQERLHEIAQARYDAGETGALEINLATVALARARAALASAMAAEAAALADLAATLQLTGDDLPGVTGELAWPALPDLAAVQAAAAAQPALAGLAARQAQAQAIRHLAGAAAWPEVGVFSGWGREEDVDVVHFGLIVGLPVFARGQGERQAADAEVLAAGIELDAAQRTFADQAARAWRRQRDVLAASDTIGGEAAAALAASVGLAEDSYRLGEIALDEVLLVQREQLEARRELNDLQLAAALAAVDVAEIAALPPLGRGETP